jgi:hypothetical protein
MSERDTLPPGADSDPINDPEHQALVSRIERGLSERFSDTLARQAALETLVQDQASKILALEKAVSIGHRETMQGQRLILEAVSRYFDELTKLVTRIEQVGARLEKLEHEHRLNHPQRLSGSPSSTS